MTRRDFIALLGGTAVWPLAARAQQQREIRRIGVLMNQAASDSEGQSRLAAFRQALYEMGRVVGSTVQIDVRWGQGDSDLIRRYATELVGLRPDVILVNGAAQVTQMLQATRTIPVVFVQVPDPVGAGFAASLARPGGNATGFTQFEFGLSAKWPELLKQLAPHVTRVAVLRDQATPSGVPQFAAIQAVAPTFGMQATAIGMHDAVEIERGITAFARQSNGGLIVTASGPSTLHRELIVMLASRNQLPAVYPYRFFADGGGLISYGPDTVDPYRRAADYVDRILKGEKPADLPVQAPTKYELVINLKTAKALGLDVPPTLLARADEVIE